MIVAIWNIRVSNSCYAHRIIFKARVCRHTYSQEATGWSNKKLHQYFMYPRRHRCQLNKMFRNNSNTYYKKLCRCLWWATYPRSTSMWEKGRTCKRCSDMVESQQQLRTTPLWSRCGDVPVFSWCSCWCCILPLFSFCSRAHILMQRSLGHVG